MLYLLARDSTFEHMYIKTKKDFANKSRVETIDLLSCMANWTLVLIDKAPQRQIRIYLPLFVYGEYITPQVLSSAEVLDSHTIKHFAGKNGSLCVYDFKLWLMIQYLDAWIYFATSCPLLFYPNDFLITETGVGI